MSFAFKLLTSIGRCGQFGFLASISFLLSCPAPYINSNSSQQSLFTNAQGSPISVEGGPNNVLVGDMNGDRKPDLVVACGRGRNVLVLPGKGDGQFGPALSQTTVQNPPGDMALGDLNGDGKLDVALSSHDSYGVTLLLGDGKGALNTAPNSPIVMKLGQHPHTHGLAVADMNRDKNLDLITCNNNDNDISIAFGDGRGNFTRASQSFPVGPSPYPFGVGDVNNDGWLDIAATASATGPSRREQLPLSRAVTLLLSDGKGGFASRQLPIRTAEPWFAEIADVNGDGKADILATHHELNALTVLIGDGRGGFTESKGSPFDFGVFFLNLVISDVNRDGKVDVVATSGDSLRVLTGDGQGGFNVAASIPVGRGAWRIASGDVNGDRRLDVVAGNSESNSVSMLLGK
jgi:hypothetical protein